MGTLVHLVVFLLSVLSSAAGAEQVVYAQLGETVSLVPQYQSASYRYIYWYFGRSDGPPLAWRNHLGGMSVSTDDAWKNKLRLSDKSLVITSVSQENFGTFMYEIISPESEKSSIRLVQVTVNKIPASPLLPGQSLTLECNILKDNPDFYWLNPSGEKKMTSHGNLKMEVTAQDNGTWTCVVADKKQAKISVAVVDLSPAPPHPLYVSTSAPITVPCSVAPHVSWEHFKSLGIQEFHWQFVPGQTSDVGAAKAQRLFFLSLDDPMRLTADQHRDLKPVQDPVTGNFSLTRERGREQDTGNYVCTVKFKSGQTLNRTVRVQMLQIIASPGAELITGQSLNLTCSVGQPLPSDLHLRWFRPKQSSRSAVTSERFTVAPVAAGDGGNWRCELWEGKTQVASATITLKIDGKFNVWLLVIICSAAVTVIFFVVLSLCLHQRRNRKMRRLRHQLCRCKNPQPKGFYRT